MARTPRALRPVSGRVLANDRSRLRSRNSSRKRLGALQQMLSRQSEIRCVVSPGRRNSAAEDLAWFHPIEGLSRAGVQLARHRLELSPSDGGQVEALREVLPEQSVRVLVAAALPRAVRVAEV